MINKYGDSGRHHRPPVAARAASLVRHAPARPRRRPPYRAGDARPRLDLDHPGLHQGQPGTAVGRLPGRPPAGGQRVSKPRHILTKPHHLAARFFGSLSSEPPEPAEDAWAESQLLPGEVALWRQMSNQDRRHSAKVARRFVAARPEATRAEIAGALLHDVGKIECGLGTWGRVAASVVGRRGQRFTLYHDHERIGSELAVEAGSDPVTVRADRRARAGLRHVARLRPGLTSRRQRRAPDERCPHGVDAEQCVRPAVVDGRPDHHPQQQAAPDPGDPELGIRQRQGPDRSDRDQVPERRPTEEAVVARPDQDRRRRRTPRRRAPASPPATTSHSSPARQRPRRR